MTYCDENCMESEVRGYPVRHTVTGERIGMRWECSECHRTWYARVRPKRWYARLWAWLWEPLK